MEMLHERPSDTSDGETTARHEVPDTLSRLRGTHRIGAAIGDLVGAMLNRRIADRTALRHREPAATLRRALPSLDGRRVDAHDLWDDVAGSLDDHAITDTHVEALDLVQVVQRRPPHGRSADEHGREPRDGREHTRAP